MMVIIALSMTWIYVPLLILLLIAQVWQTVDGSCYFPHQYQGEYAMQSTTDRDSVQYSKVNITATAIPIWGNCHRRINNNFILAISIGDNNCIRCVHIRLRSRNILQVLTSSADTISKCYTNEQMAEQNCPRIPNSAINTNSRRFHEEQRQLAAASRLTSEIILFKTKDYTGSPIAREYCPFDGRYTFEYHAHPGQGGQGGHRTTCGESSVDTCPSGSTLNMRFKKCSGPLPQPQADFKFDCLGHWRDYNGRHVVALLDGRNTRNHQMRYRCAQYEINKQSGVTHMALSADSTCTTGLYNTTHGHEMFVLRAQEDNHWPPEVMYTQCSFPDWMKGDWAHVRYHDDVLVYHDQTSFKTYTIKCTAMLESEDTFHIFIKTQCDEKRYSCMRIQKRGHNVFEFQIGSNSSNSANQYDMCKDTNFDEGNWITEGRLDPGITEVSCPIVGEYTGVIPDGGEFCAKMWSDCRSPSLMYYQVSDCISNEVYEEREYRCLGHWQGSITQSPADILVSYQSDMPNNNLFNVHNLLYTFTQREDSIPGAYECFVGAIMPEKEDIFIREAGEHCQRRGVDPTRYGMKLVKRGEPHHNCHANAPPPATVQTNRTLQTYPPPPTQSGGGGSGSETTVATNTRRRPANGTATAWLPPHHGNGRDDDHLGSPDGNTNENQLPPQLGPTYKYPGGDTNGGSRPGSNNRPIGHQPTKPWNVNAPSYPAMSDPDSNSIPDSGSPLPSSSLALTYVIMFAVLLPFGLLRHH